MNFNEFISSKLRNAWIKEPGIEIYVRKSISLHNHGDFELASMQAKAPGKGALTRFLNKYEPLYSFYVENIQNMRLERMLTRRGYKYANIYAIPSMIKEITCARSSVGESKSFLNFRS